MGSRKRIRVIDLILSRGCEKIIIAYEKNFHPFQRPLLGKGEEGEVIDTLHSGWSTARPKTKKSEKKFAKYIKAKNTIGLNFCTAAFHLALVASKK